MARTKRVFISDVHLSSQERYEATDEMKRARFIPDKHKKRLVNFLTKSILGNEKEIKDLVLVGDIFDDWVCPPDEAPPTFDRIFESNPDIMDALRAIGKSKINLYYLPGNHDYGMQKPKIQSAIPGVVFQRAYDDPQLNIHAEHGNKFVLFNKSISGIANGRPLGYFVTRLTEHLGGYVTRFHDLVSYSDDIFEFAMGKTNFFSALIDALAERAKVKEIVMNAQGRKLSIQQIKKMYKPLTKKYGTYKIITRIGREAELEQVGDHLAYKKRYKAVIFGHTHKAKMDWDPFLVANRVYANTGCWCQKKAHCVVADVDTRGRGTIKLFRVRKSGSMKVVDTEKL